MAEHIPIRSLIERCRTRDPSRARDTALPKPIADSLVLWDSVGLRLAEEFSEKLNAEAAVKVSLAITTAAACRQASPKPGVVVPLGATESEPMARFPAGSARVFADRLLRERNSEARGEDDVSDSDTLMIRELLDVIAGLLHQAFGLDIGVPEKLSPSRRWSLTAPPAGDRLLARFDVTLDGLEAQIELLFAETLTRFFADLLTGASGSLSPQSITMDLSGVLSRWHADTDELSAIVPGAAILIPGANLEKVAVEIDGGGPGINLAHAELGTSRGRHALKITEVRTNS